VTALREIKFLQRVNHPNIVKLKEVVTSKATDATRNKGSVFMVFEYAVCDLVGLMDSAQLNESHIMGIMKQLLGAVHYAHVNNVLHRDIKPANILMTSDGYVKLADWGLCRKSAPGGKFTNRVVTRWYRAPELLLGEQQYSAAIDMWSVGCVMAELFLKRAIFPGKDDLDQLKLIFDLCGKPSLDGIPQSWSHLSNVKDIFGAESQPSQLNLRFAFLKPAAQDLILRMLELDPAKRISAKDALTHDWFWGQIPPSPPHLLPVPKGDGLHEHQLREESARREKRMHDSNHGHAPSQPSGHPHASQAPGFDKRYKHAMPQ
jgi:cyclin-dependent kinase 12/13